MRASLTAAAAVLVLAGCGGHAEVEATGDPDAGARAIVERGCGACHTIPGIENADAIVGPSLAEFERTRAIAGNLANTPENAARWIRDPDEIEPGTLMPDLGVGGNEAEDIVAYLYCCT